MLKKSMGRYKAIGIILLVLCLLAIAGNIVCFTMAVPAKLKIGAVLGLLGCAAALYYMFNGYGKNAAFAYKAFMIIMFVTFQLMTVTVNMKIDAVATIVSMSACLKAAFALALAISLDLGEKRSKGMALTVAIIATVELIAAIALIYVPGAARGGAITVTAAALRSASNLFVAWMGCAMTWAKYKDKLERGSK